MSDSADETAQTPIRVRGSASTFNSRVRERLSRGRDIAGELESGREHVDKYTPEPGGGLAATFERMQYERTVEDLERKVADWRRGNDGVLAKFLGKDAVHFERGAAPGPRVPREDLDGRLDRLTSALDVEVARLESVRARVVRARAVQGDRGAGGFADLIDSGLIEAEALAAYIARIERARSRPEIADSLAASKKLVEATHRAVLQRLGVGYEPGDDVGKLAKASRAAISARESADELVTGDLAKALELVFNGMGTVERGLAAVRNAVGTGHGRPQLSDQAVRRHALLAADLAEANTHYLALSLRDLNVV